MNWQDYYLWELVCELGTIKQGQYGASPPDQAAHVSKYGQPLVLQLVEAETAETVLSVRLPVSSRPDYFRRVHGIVGRGVQDVTFYIGWRCGDDYYFEPIDTAGQVTCDVSP